MPEKKENETMNMNDIYNAPVPLEVTRASEVKLQEVKWLWYPYIPCGKVTLLQGDPGDGKSKMMLAISALLTWGKPLPFSEEAEEPMTVIYQTTEDDAGDTVVPRFLSAGGDMEKLVFIREDKKNLSFGDERIREAIIKYKARLLILDPMTSYLGRNCSMNMANEVRSEFNHLIRVSAETGCAIVIIAHMNKMEGINPMYRTTGSIDIAGAVRSILAITRTESDNPRERYMVQVKSNLAPLGTAILFEITDQGVLFLRELRLTAREAFAMLAPAMGRPSEKCDSALNFISEMLSDGKWHDADECITRLTEAGIKQTTFKKAKKMLGVVTEKQHFKYRWRLPSLENDGDEEETAKEKTPDESPNFTTSSSPEPEGK